MTLIYTLEHAHEWAEFSGDYNPIHFDVNKAKAMGIEGLTVHGMRALLDMKKSQDFPSDTADYYRFNARLRNPIKCHTEYKIVKTNNQCQLIENETDSCFFSARLERISPPVEQVTTKNLTLSADELLNIRREYPFMKNVCEWSFLDSVLFRLIVKSPEIFEAIKVKLPDLHAGTLTDIFREMPVVQTHHEIVFSRQFLLSSPGSNDFHYGMLPLLVVGDYKQGLVVRIAMQGYYFTHSYITTAITLKLKPMALS